MRLPIWLLFLMMIARAWSANPDPSREAEVVVVVGAAGTAEYGAAFRTQAETWKAAAEGAGVPVQVIGLDSVDESDLSRLQRSVEKALSKVSGQFWLVLIGHGTFDGRTAKFNLNGPDISAEELAGWLKPLKRELVFIHTGSASGGFIRPLTGDGRILITATKSADEIYYPRFGEHFAPAIAGLFEADLDQDGQTSVLEAFIYAAGQAARYYENEERLATEHALIEDNADGIGTRFEVYEGIKASDPKADGQRAMKVALVLSPEEQKLTDAQRQTRDELEGELERLKSRRTEMAEDDYYAALEKILRKLGELYR